MWSRGYYNLESSATKKGKKIEQSGKTVFLLLPTSAGVRQTRKLAKNNKNLTRFLPGFLKIIRTYEKSEAPKSLRGGGIIITPVV